jgi:CRP-like cAMP-binding protein
LFDFIYRHLTAAEIDLAAPNGPAPDQSLRKGRGGVERLLELVPIFTCFTTEERAALAAKLTPQSSDQGDTVSEPGVVPQSLYIVGSGVLSVTCETIEGDIEAYRLGPGDYFGEIGLLSGKPRPARITALTPATVYELAKADLTPILEARPQIAQEMGRVLAQRLAAGRLIAGDELDETIPKHRLKEWFAERLHRLRDVVIAG